MSVKKNQLVTSGALLIALMALIYIAFFITDKIYSSSQIVGDEIAKLDKRRLSTENLRDNLTLVKEISHEIESYDQYFFNQGEELRLITDLENIAAKHKMSQKILTSNLDNYLNNRIDITLNLTGPYDNLLNYLSDLEAYHNIIAIQKIEFQPSGFSTSDPNELTAILRIQISLYANPKPTN